MHAFNLATGRWEPETLYCQHRLLTGRIDHLIDKPLTSDDRVAFQTVVNATTETLDLKTTDGTMLVSWNEDGELEDCALKTLIDGAASGDATVLTALTARVTALEAANTKLIGILDNLLTITGTSIAELMDE